MHTHSVKRYAVSPQKNQTNNKPVKISWRKLSLQALFLRLLYLPVSFFGWPFDLFFLFSFLHLLFFPLCLFFPLLISILCLFCLDQSGRKDIWPSLVCGPTGIFHIATDITKNQALQLIPRTDCWHRRPADKCWNFQKNIVVLKVLTTCQAECSLACTWHRGNTDFASPECHSGKVKKVV